MLVSIYAKHSAPLELWPQFEILIYKHSAPPELKRLPVGESETAGACRNLVGEMERELGVGR